RLVPKPGLVNAEYLCCWRSANKSYIQSLGRGATFKEISKDVVSSIEIPLPSYDEQRRIAEVLDRADELRAKRRQALAHLDDLTQSIFLESIPHATPIMPLGEHLLFITSGSRGWAKFYSESGSRFIRSLDVRMNEID